MAGTSTLVDLVKILATSTGTGSLTLGAAVPAYRGTEALVDGSTYSYSIQQGNNYEYGTGLYSAQDSTLTRGVIGSSYGGQPLQLSANAVVTFTALAQDFARKGAAGDDGPQGPRGAGINMPTVESAASLTLGLDDANTYQRITSAAGVVVSLPASAQVAFPRDTVIAIEQAGPGTVTITPAQGVTIESRGGLLETAGQYAVVQLKCLDTDLWALLGDAGPMPVPIPEAPTDGGTYARKNAAWVPAGGGGGGLGGIEDRLFAQIIAACKDTEYGADGGSLGSAAYGTYTYGPYLAFHMYAVVSASYANRLQTPPYVVPAGKVLVGLKQYVTGNDQSNPGYYNIRVVNDTSNRIVSSGYNNDITNIDGHGVTPNSSFGYFTPDTANNTSRVLHILGVAGDSLHTETWNPSGDANTRTNTILCIGMLVDAVTWEPDWTVAP